MSIKNRVCVIGAGPSGMSVLYHFNRSVSDAPEVVCYEKQSDWGGLWNFSWRTGLDEHGELCHNGMYHDLWTNAPKEVHEYPDYTWIQHFGKPVPSFPPRECFRHYLEGRWTRDNIDLRRHIRFSTIVKHVEYHADTDDFSVKTKNLAEDRDQKIERFSHVIVATGIFNVPNSPSFPGMDTFPGRILHSHDFRDARDFKGKRLLVIGAGYSAEDVALQCMKFGAEKIICSYRETPMNFKWPKETEERPILEKVRGNTVYFKDGTSADVDVICLCSGYKYHYPFLPDDLRLKAPKSSYYPPNLYKGILWLKGGNKKLLYIGTQVQYYSFTMFDVEALWACNFILGKLPDNNLTTKEMAAHAEKWLKAYDALKDRLHATVDFQSKFVTDLSNDVNYPMKADQVDVLWHRWLNDKVDSIVAYRDKSFTSVHSGTKAPFHHTPFMKAYDDTVDTFVNQTPNKV